MMGFWGFFEGGVIPGGGLLLGIGVGRRDVGAPKLDEQLFATAMANSSPGGHAAGKDWLYNAAISERALEMCPYIHTDGLSGWVIL